jgi:hypothetical protein
LPPRCGTSVPKGRNPLGRAAWDSRGTTGGTMSPPASLRVAPCMEGAVGWHRVCREVWSASERRSTKGPPIVFLRRACRATRTPEGAARNPPTQGSGRCTCPGYRCGACRRNASVGLSGPSAAR